MKVYDIAVGEFRYCTEKYVPFNSEDFKVPARLVTVIPRPQSWTFGCCEVNSMYRCV